MAILDSGWFGEMDGTGSPCEAKRASPTARTDSRETRHRTSALLRSIVVRPECSRRQIYELTSVYEVIEHDRTTVERWPEKILFALAMTHPLVSLLAKITMVWRLVPSQARVERAKEVRVAVACDYCAAVLRSRREEERAVN